MCGMPTVAFHSMYLLNPALYQISSILVILSPIVLIANSYTHCNDRHRCMNWLLRFAVVRRLLFEIGSFCDHFMITLGQPMNHLVAAW